MKRALALQNDDEQFVLLRALIGAVGSHEEEAANDFTFVHGLYGLKPYAWSRDSMAESLQRMRVAHELKQRLLAPPRGRR